MPATTASRARRSRRGNDRSNGPSKESASAESRSCSPADLTADRVANSNTKSQRNESGNDQSSTRHRPQAGQPSQSATNKWTATPTDKQPAEQRQHARKGANQHPNNVVATANGHAFAPPPFPMWSLSPPPAWAALSFLRQYTPGAFEAELAAFVAHAALRGPEAAVREETRETIADCARSLWPRSEHCVFGSYAAGLSIANSDIDVAIAPNDNGGGVELDPIESMYMLTDVIERTTNYSAQVLAEARVPIVRVVNRTVNPPLLCDINVVASLVRVKAVVARQRAFVAAHPEAVSLIVATKALLRQWGLNNVFTGGLSSTAIFGLVQRFVTLCHSPPPSPASMSTASSKGSDGATRADDAGDVVVAPATMEVRSTTRNCNINSGASCKSCGSSRSTSISPDGSIGSGMEDHGSRCCSDTQSIGSACGDSPPTTPSVGFPSVPAPTESGDGTGVAMASGATTPTSSSSFPLTPTTFVPATAVIPVLPGDALLKFWWYCCGEDHYFGFRVIDEDTSNDVSAGTFRVQEIQLVIGHALTAVHGLLDFALASKTQQRRVSPVMLPATILATVLRDPRPLVASVSSPVRAVSVAPQTLVKPEAPISIRVGSKQCPLPGLAEGSAILTAEEATRLRAPPPVANEVAAL